MSITWHENPPAAPPVTDEDPCVTWHAADEAAHAAAHEHRWNDHAADAPVAPAAPASSYTWSGYDAPTPPPPLPLSSPPPTTRGSGARVVLVGMALAGVLGAGFAARGLLDSTSPAAVTPATQAAAAAGATTGSTGSTPYVAGSDEEPVVAVAKALGPSVVLIKTTDGLGSGVVYDSKGLILTNAHVVGSSDTVSVQLGDGKTVDGKVLGADTANDIAVVQVEPGDDIVAARLATTTPTVGQLAVGIGSPFGLEETVTAGVVSAVNRPVDNGAGGVASMIQTDAPINPGNSGGALANRHGEVIGINSMIYSEKGENNGIGFAIPIDRAKSVADKLVSGDRVDRGYLGVATQPTENGDPGAQVTKIESGSAAAKAGLQNGDVITAVDGTQIKQASDLAALIGTKSPGDRIRVEVDRAGTTVQLDVTLGTRPAQSSTGSGSGSQDQGPGSSTPSTPSTPGGRSQIPGQK